MRPNNTNKRLRGRNRNKSGNPLARSYESNGPDVKIRGSALQVADKYAQLARDAQSAGDRVMAENYLQHAEHYYRIVAAAYEQNNQRPPHVRQDERRFEGDYRGEQPHINGFDGLDEDDDGGLRRALRGNEHGGDGDDEDDGDDVPEARNGHHQPRDSHNQHTHSHGQPRQENGHANGVGNGHDADAQPNSSYEAAEAGEAGDEEDEGGDARPKRRSRSSRSRSRRRSAVEAGSEGTAVVPVTVVEPTEPTS
jgi:hypothetical protein